MRHRMLISSMLAMCAAALFWTTMARSARADAAGELKVIEARQKACIDKDSSNAGMIECSGAADAAADKVLNRIYKSIVTQLKAAKGDDAQSSKEILDRLVASERAWVAYRDAECTLQGAEMLGGSGENLTIVDCQFTMTSERAKVLDAFAKNR